MRIGILCPSEIALRRFMPALEQVDGMNFVGLAVNSPEERYGDKLPDNTEIDLMLAKEREKAQAFINGYGGKIFNSYEEIIASEEIGALYIPLPPGLHFKWAQKALIANKHVLVEKPSTMKASDTEELIKIAKKRGMALHENYMFSFHSQLDEIDNIIHSGELGQVRLYRVNFGFPIREQYDFSYVIALGGGALMDAGGYTIKYACRLLGCNAKIAYAQLNKVAGYEVDMFGSGVLVNEEGMAVQIAFGMDNAYKCELEVWGSKGCLVTNRILTAPGGFKPFVRIKKNNEEEIRSLSVDDTFKKSIEYFISCIKSKEVRFESYKAINRQAKLVEDFYSMSQNHFN